MRQAMLFYVLSILLSMTSHKSFAYDIAVENADGVTIYYNYINDGKELAVTRRTGPFSNYTGNINIPETVTFMGRERAVTTIQSQAFSEANLKSLTIPQSIVNIEANAFSCIVDKMFINDLNSWIERDFVNISGLKVNHLYKDNNEEIKYLEIPNIITKIGNYAFSSFYGIESISIPSSVKTIGNSAFSNCQGVKTINISEGVTAIGNNAFHGCNIQSINIPSTVETIGNYAFSGCSNLNNLTLSDGITNIGSHAFSFCYCLNSVYIPKSVTHIDVAPFSNCNLRTIIVDENNTYYDSRNNCNAIINTESNALIQGAKYGNIPKSVTSIGTNAFCGCSIDSLVIPENVKYIADNAFSYVNLKTITSKIKEPTYISDCAFNDNTFYNITLVVPRGTIDKYRSTRGWNKFLYMVQSEYGEVDGFVFKFISGTECEVAPKEDCYIGNIVIPEMISEAGKEYKVTAIGDYVFSGCYELESVIIPNSIRSIGKYAFYGCSLNTVVIPNSVVTIGENAFSGSKISSIEIPNSITAIEYGTFISCGSLKSLIIPNSVEEIGEEAFLGCSNLETVVLPNDLKKIGPSSFFSCSRLKEIKIPEELKHIGAWTFRDCNLLETVVIPNKVTSIGDAAFASCWNLKTIVFGEKVKTIGQAAFSGCSSLREIYSLNLNPPTLDVPDNDSHRRNSNDIRTTFETRNMNIYNNATLYVPIGTIEKYKSTDGWKDFKNIKEGNKSPDNKTYTLSITAMGNGSASYNGTNVINSTKTFSVKEGASAKVFFNPDDGYQIARATMNGRNIVDLSTMSFTIDIMDEDVTIEVVFEAIPEGKEKCGANVYYSYDEITHTLTISGNGDMSDYDDDHNKAPWSSYASEIQKIKIGSGITTIGNFTFYHCRNITSLTIPSAVTSIGSSAFEGCIGLASLTLSDGLESIGGSAFESCTGLKNLVIPSTVNTISINAFRNCKGITDVYCYAENVPETDENAFDGTPTEKSTLHVPANAIEAYKAAWPWSDFKEIVALTNNPDGILEIKQLDDSQVPYYDLYGRKIHQPQQKGLYIQNGKIIVVK